MMKPALLLIVLLGGISLYAIATEIWPEKPKGKLFHLVSFKFKENATPEQIREVEEAFRDLKRKIRQIQSYDSGVNISPERLNKGFTHGFVLTFKNDQARDAYLNHPDHKAFGTLLK